MKKKSLLSSVPQNKPVFVTSAKEQPFCETLEIQCVYISIADIFGPSLIFFSWSLCSLLNHRCNLLLLLVAIVVVDQIKVLPSEAKRDEFFQSRLHFWVWQGLCLDFTSFLKETHRAIPIPTSALDMMNTALLGCPDAAVGVLCPVLWSSTYFCPPQALVLSAAPVLLLQLQSTDLALVASYAATLSLSASKVPSRLWDVSEVKQSCYCWGKPVSLWGLRLWWGEESLTSNPAPLQKLRPWE